MNKIERKKAVKYASIAIIAVLMIGSISFAQVLSDSGSSLGDRGSRLKVIVGDSEKCGSGAPPTTGSPVTATSSLGTRTSTTLSDGTFQVDISGSGPGDPDWPDGTSFTISITDGSWSGSAPGTVSGTATDVGMVTLYPPVLEANADASPTTIVAGETVSFTGSATGGSTPYTWSWNFGGDGTSTLQNPTHTFNTPGTYNCILTVTDACGSSDASDPVPITVNAALSCDAGGPYSGTICTAVMFSGSAAGGHPGYTYDWDFGDGSAHSSDQNPSHQYASDGSYTATLTVTDSNSDTAVDTAPVTISTSALVADAGGPYSGTVCNPVSFSGSATGGCTPYTYSWDFGDGGTGSGQNPTHQYTSDGSYTATVTVTDNNGASDTDTASVTISTTELVADANGPYNGCTGDPIDFEGSATGGCSPYSYSWTFGDGGSSSQQNPSHSYGSPGSYTVTLTVTDNVGTTDSDTATVTVNNCELDVDAGGPYNAEVDEEIQFSGSASSGTAPYYYQWSFGDGSISEEQNPTHSYSAPSPAEGYKVVLYVVDSQGTSGQDQTRAYVTGSVEEPTANAGGPYTGIVNDTIAFTGNAYGGTAPYTYSWDFDASDGIGEDSTLQNPTHLYDTPGTYTVTLTVTDDNGKTDDDTATVTIEEEGPDDTTPPTVQITKPTGGLYLGNNQIIELNTPVIIGSIDIEVTATDDQSGINKVEFYIDNVLQETLSSSPYTWTWSETAFFKHTIKVVAYDNADNSNSAELEVWKFF